MIDMNALAMNDMEMDMVSGGAEWICTKGVNTKGEVTVSMVSNTVGADGIPMSDIVGFNGECAKLYTEDFMRQHSGDTFLTADGKPFKF